MTTLEILKDAKQAKLSFSGVTTAQKDKALLAMADALEQNADDIIAANRKDVEAAENNGTSKSMIDRLMLDENRIKGMANGIREVAALNDPVGRVLDEHQRSDGLKIQKVSVPLGVVAIIYESRPNVTSDAAALALKSGNVCVLRCGKEAHASAAAIVDALRVGLASCGLPETLINLVEDTTRASAAELMTANGYVDLLIPRGGAGLINACVENATVPCIQTGTGICHIYVDKDADINMALDITENAKASRPSVCNAAETCLVHSDIADEFLPLLKERFTTERKAKGLTEVEMHLDEKAAEIIDGIPASGDDFNKEYLDYIMAVGVVDSADDAISHISAHSTGHSESIVTDNAETAAKFLNQVDSAAVYHNASTRFTDGGEFGLGCEMGISTQRLHARGPMGLCELTTYKYVIYGNGQDSL